MRMLMKWTLGTREASEAIHSGRMADVNKTLDELTKPEAQYWGHLSNCVKVANNSSTNAS